MNTTSQISATNAVVEVDMGPARADGGSTASWRLNDPQLLHWLAVSCLAGTGWLAGVSQPGIGPRHDCLFPAR